MAKSNRQNNEVLLHAFESAVKNFGPVANEPFRLFKTIMLLAPVAVHWMITFHLALFILACMAGPNGKSPSLMPFVLLTYVLAIVLWPIKNLIEKLCCNAFGLMLLMTALFLIFYFANGHLLVGLENIARWIREGTQEGLPLPF